MTLIPFTPEKLDALALHLLDLAATVRKMANSSREHGVSDFELHGQKIDEWLVKLEDWTHDGAGKLEAAINKQRGDRRAQALPSATPAAPPAKATAGRKKKD